MRRPRDLPERDGVGGLCQVNPYWLEAHVCWWTQGSHVDLTPRQYRRVAEWLRKVAEWYEHLATKQEGER